MSLVCIENDWQLINPLATVAGRQNIYIVSSPCDVNIISTHIFLRYNVTSLDRCPYCKFRKVLPCYALTDAHLADLGTMRRAALDQE